MISEFIYNQWVGYTSVNDMGRNWEKIPASDNILVHHATATLYYF